MPNILVYIDLRDGRPTPPTLFALAEARRVARLAGSSVFAVLVTPPLATEDLDVLARPIAGAGADKLLVCEDTAFAGPAADPSHGQGLDAAVARVAPLMVLFPAGGVGAALGPSLAARLGGPYAAWCDLRISDADARPDAGGRVQLTRCRSDGRPRLPLDPLEIGRPVVAVTGAGRRPPPVGRIGDLEVEVVNAIAPIADPQGSGARIVLEEGERRPHPHARVQLASILVLVADGDDGQPAIDAAALRGSVPAGVAVENVADLPPAVLDACCPDIVLRIGSSAARTSRSPRTCVVLAAIASPIAAVVPDDVDIVWQLPSPDDLTATAVAALLAEIGEAP